MLAVRVVLALSIVVSAHASANAAATAPKQLYNKTVTITWGESGSYTRVSDGKSASPVGQFQAIVYVSSAGRAFVRASQKAGTFGGTRERGPAENNARFEGNSLVMTGGSLGVARRIVTSFDPSFASCSTSITIGKVGPNATLTGFDGALYKVVSMQPGAANCAIRDGNALAN